MKPFRKAVLVLVPLALLLTGCDDGTGPDDDLDPFLGCSNVRAYTIGSTVNGTLRASACRFADDPTDFYEFQLASQSTVTIDLTSNTLDAWLFLWERDTADLLTFDDDGGGGLNARIVEDLAPGTYVIGATSFDGDTGSYTLTSSR